MHPWIRPTPPKVWCEVFTVHVTWKLVETLVRLDVSFMLQCYSAHNWRINFQNSLGIFFSFWDEGANDLKSGFLMLQCWNPKFTKSVEVFSKMYPMDWLSFGNSSGFGPQLSKFYQGNLWNSSHVFSLLGILSSTTLITQDKSMVKFYSQIKYVNWIKDKNQISFSEP